MYTLQEAGTRNAERVETCLRILVATVKNEARRSYAPASFAHAVFSRKMRMACPYVKVRACTGGVARTYIILEPRSVRAQEFCAYRLGCKASKRPVLMRGMGKRKSMSQNVFGMI